MRTIAAGVLLAALLGGVLLSAAPAVAQSGKAAKPSEPAAPASGKPAAPANGKAGPPNAGKSKTAPQQSAGPRSGNAGKPPAKPRKASRRKKAATQPSKAAPASAPATQPSGPETALQMLERLRGIAAQHLSDELLATRAALEFCDALAQGDGAAATAVLDAPGYQPLPADGAENLLPLGPNGVPEPPANRKPGELAAAVAALPRWTLAEAPSERFKLISREKLHERMPLAGQWMLPGDFALLLEAGALGPQTPPRTACLVMRVRGSRAVVLGGNLVESWQ